MKTTRITILFFSALCSVTVLSTIFSAEKEVPLLRAEGEGVPLPTTVPSLMQESCPQENVFAKDIQEKFREAIEHGDINTVRSICYLNVDINKKGGKKDYTPLMLSLEHKHFEIAKLLIEFWADVYKKNNYGYTVLDLTECSHVTELLTTIQYHIDQEKQSHVEKLTYAVNRFAATEDQTIFKSLLANKASVNQRDRYGATALLYTTLERWWPEAIGLLIQYKADVNQQAYEGGPTPLAITAYYGWLEKTALLLAGRADPNQQIKNNRTPLMLAAGHDHPRIVKLLLANNADVNRKDTIGYTASAFAQSREVIKLLASEEVTSRFKDTFCRSLISP